MIEIRQHTDPWGKIHLQYRFNIGGNLSPASLPAWAVIVIWSDWQDVPEVSATIFDNKKS